MSDEISTQVIEGTDARLEVDSAELKVIAGPDRGRTIALRPDTLSIGTSSGCDLVLSDTTVSARHAQIVLVDGGYELHDIGSTNGVRVGALRVKRLALVDKMRFLLGDSELVVRRLGARLSLPLSTSNRFDGLTVHSLKMRLLVGMLEQLAESDVSVLFEGETGAGKEVVAQALHGASHRRRGPFVVVDCGAIPPSMLAAELFGHERGAFTGAQESRPGLFEEADGGTLFLDEVGELPLEAQAAVLGAIERKRSRRIGGRRDVTHDFRICAATHRNLAEEVRQGRFRQDLYYRLVGTLVRVPPLRERREDIPHIAAQFAKHVGIAFSPDLAAICAHYHWPGNVRELRNTVQRFAAQPHALEPHLPVASPRSDLEAHLYAAPGELYALADFRRNVVEEIERYYVHQVLVRAQGQITAAAAIAQVARPHFSRLVQKYGLRPYRSRA